MSAKHYDDDKAVDYLNIICTAHNCKKLDMNAADPNVYRRFIDKANHYLSIAPLDSKGGSVTFTKEQYKAYTDYVLSAGEIIANITGAVYQLSKDREDFNPEQYEELENIPLRLLPDVDNIISAIDRTKRVINKID